MNGEEFPCLPACGGVVAKRLPQDRRRDRALEALRRRRVGYLVELELSNVVGRRLMSRFDSMLALACFAVGSCNRTRGVPD